MFEVINNILKYKNGLDQNVIRLLLIVFAKIIITSAQISASTCGPSFPNACTCGNELYEGELQYVVNCTKAGLQNTSVLEFMPQEVQILIFTGNYITELPWNVFGSINDYSYLKIVDMSSNHIREIRGKSYHHVQNVERLILNHNNLSISAQTDDKDTNHHHPRVFSNFLNLQSLHLTDAFDDNSSPRLSQDLHDIFMYSHLTKLQKLHLEQNEITHFGDRQVFCSLPSLRDLHLGDNQLSEINFEVHCLKNLRFLDLERNRFQFVKAHDMLLLNELENRRDRTTNLIVDFSLNPFNCSCKLAEFYTWAQMTNVTIRNKEKLMCYREQMVALPIMQMDMNGSCNAAVAAATVLFKTDAGAGDSDKLITALNSQTQVNPHTVTLIFLLVVLSMILIGLVGTLVYVSRDKLRVVLTPVFDHAAKKVHYTSIKDEDCPEVHV